MKILKYIFIVSIIIFSISGFFVIPEHPHFIWEKIPAFDAIFGFIGCFVLIFFAKSIGRHWLQKNEDYYD